MDLLYQPQCIWIDEYPEHGRLHAGWTPILSHDIYRPDSSRKNSIPILSRLPYAAPRQPFSKASYWGNASNCLMNFSTFFL